MLLAAFLQALQPGSECRQRWPLPGPLFSLFLRQLAEAACCCGPGVNSPLAVPASRTASGEASAAPNPGEKKGFIHLGAAGTLPWGWLW